MKRDNRKRWIVRPEQLPAVVRRCPKCGQKTEFENSGRFPCSEAGAMLPGLVNKVMERDPEKWTLYTPRPSEFIHSPDSCFYKGNEEVVERELDYLIDTRNPGGVWNITWTWFDLGEKYSKEFAISENWWMAQKAMEKLRFLMAFGRV